MNRDEHILAALIFNFVYWTISFNNGFMGLLMSSVFAFWGGLMPDMLEPPTWRGHRGVFHYVGRPLSILPTLLFLDSNLILFMVGGFCIGYFSHFILDVF